MAKERKASVAEYVDAMRRVRKEAKHVKVYNLEGSEASFIIKEHLSGRKSEHGSGYCGDDFYHRCQWS